MKLKVVVYTKSGNKLAYYENGTQDEVKDAWRSFLAREREAVSFGNFSVPVENIDYVEVLPN